MNEKSSNIRQYRDDRMQRLSLLPAFPSLSKHGVIVYNQRDHLLLANVPEYQLNYQQKTERNTIHTSSTPTLIRYDPNVHNNYGKASFLIDLYRTLYVNLIDRLYINENIIDYNYIRMLKCFEMMNYERCRSNLNEDNTTILEQLPFHEYPIAIEFYLQIDVDLFFMKTCHFRGAKPCSSSKQKGLFLKNEPDTRYGMSSCQFNTCRFCYPNEEIKKIRQHQLSQHSSNEYEPVIRFTSQQKHRFVSGYEAILNCPVSCETTFIIYALTCPCDKFDYIGYTATTIQRRLYYHRLHGNRIMREFLLGQKNVQFIDQTVKSHEDLSKDGMQLYRHSARCPVVMQWFLNMNPKFWSFVPMLKSDADKDNLTFTLPGYIPHDPSSPITNKLHQRSDHDAGICMINLPPLPNEDYTFSNRQCFEQFESFRNMNESFTYNIDLDLYNASIIAVLPEGSSIPLQRFIESLFITHANTRLNTMGHLDNNIDKTDMNLYGMTGNILIRDRGDWCQNLVRPT